MTGIITFIGALFVYAGTRLFMPNVISTTSASGAIIAEVVPLVFAGAALGILITVLHRN